MTLKALVATAALVAAFFMPAAAHGAGVPVCAERATVLDELARRYREAPVALGLANNGGVVELFASADGATWTLLITLPSGLSCMMAAGEDWQALPARTPGGGRT